MRWIMELHAGYCSLELHHRNQWSLPPHWSLEDACQELFQRQNTFNVLILRTRLLSPCGRFYIGTGLSRLRKRHAFFQDSISADSSSPARYQCQQRVCQRKSRTREQAGKTTEVCQFLIFSGGHSHHYCQSMRNNEFMNGLHEWSTSKVREHYCCLTLQHSPTYMIYSDTLCSSNRYNLIIRLFFPLPCSKSDHMLKVFHFYDAYQIRNFISRSPWSSFFAVHHKISYLSVLYQQVFFTSKFLMLSAYSSCSTAKSNTNQTYFRRAMKKLI
jgi:hypothetical protein